MPASKPRLELIEWLDANVTIQSLDVDDLPGLSLITTVGYVVKENRRSLWISNELVLAPGNAADDDPAPEWRGTTIIPCSLITRRRALTERRS